MVTVPGLSEKKNLQKVMDEDKHTVIFDLDGQITEYMSLVILYQHVCIHGCGYQLLLY